MRGRLHTARETGWPRRGSFDSTVLSRRLFDAVGTRSHLNDKVLCSYFSLGSLHARTPLVNSFSSPLAPGSGMWWGRRGAGSWLGVKNGCNCPGKCGSAGWVSSRALKGCRFNPPSGHTHSCRLDPWLGEWCRNCEAAHWCFTLASMFPSLSPLSSLSR